MDKSRYKSSFLGKAFPFIGFAVIFAIVLFIVMTGLAEARTASDAEGLRIAEKSVLRAVISCYAAEGKFPPNFEYLVENYGIRINEEKFIVHYNIFAANIMPDVVVLLRSDDMVRR